MSLPGNQKQRQSESQPWVERLDRSLPYLFPAPAVTFIGLLVLFPLVYTLYLSLHDWFVMGLRPPSFVGIDNYVRLLQSERFLSSVAKTVYFLGLSISLQIFFGTALALFFQREFIGKSIVRTLLLLPMVATPVAVALVFMMMLDPSIGIINYFLTQLGLSAQPWLADTRLVIPALSLIELWRWTPFVMLIVMAGLAAMPHEPFEAARIDGATYFQTLRFITLPLLRPTLMVAVLFRLVDGLKTFDIIAATTAGGPAWASEILYVYAYNQAFVGYHFGFGSTIIVVFALIIFVVAMIVSKLRRGEY